MGGVQIIYPSLHARPFLFLPPGHTPLAEIDDFELKPKGTRTPGRTRLAPTGLFVRFAELRGDKRGFEEFASRFGPLTQNLLPPAREVDETLGQWNRAHSELVRAVDLWRSTMTDSGRISGELAALCQPHLDRGLYVFLSPDDPRSGFPSGLVAMPRNLLSLMWIQLAQAASGEGDLRKCEECPNWFVVTHDNRARGSRKYCSTTCRVNAYRRLSRRGGGEEGDDGR